MAESDTEKLHAKDKDKDKEISIMLKPLKVCVHLPLMFAKLCITQSIKVIIDPSLSSSSNVVVLHS